MEGVLLMSLQEVKTSILDMYSDIVRERYLLL